VMKPALSLRIICRDSIGHKKLPYQACHVFKSFPCHFRVYRQCERFGGGCFGFGEMPGRIAKVCEALLRVQRNQDSKFPYSRRFPPGMTSACPGHGVLMQYWLYICLYPGSAFGVRKPCPARPPRRLSYVPAFFLPVFSPGIEILSI
jgi:hypothetical protein